MDCRGQHSRRETREETDGGVEGQGPRARPWYGDVIVKNNLLFVRFLSYVFLFSISLISALFF